MSQLTDQELRDQSLVIRNETAALANTKERHDTMNQNIIDSKINNDKIIDQDDMAADSALHVPSQRSVKAFVEDSIAVVETDIDSLEDDLDFALIASFRSLYGY